MLCSLHPAVFVGDALCAVSFRVMQDVKELWDSRYGAKTVDQVADWGDAWLERWQHLLLPGVMALDIGCGCGHSARWLLDHGIRVIACDLSAEALRICRELAPGAQYQMVDLRRPLPFADGSFEVVVADLCLHYMPWEQTMQAMREIRRCLKAEGVLLARLNSMNELQAKAAEAECAEPGLYVVKGELKRYFDRLAVERMFAGWEVLGAQEMIARRYGGRKHLWEVAGRR